MPEVSNFAKERQSLKSVTSSACFSRAPHLTKLLSYLCEKYFGGRSGEIKEYTIATDALGRPVDIDDTGSAAARVQMHRLRNKLTEYYAQEGVDDPVRIVLKPGVYTPQFVAINSPTESQPLAARHVSLSRLWEVRNKFQPRRWVLAGVSVMLAAAAVWAALTHWQHSSLPAPDQRGLTSPPSLSPPSSTTLSTALAPARPGTFRLSPENAIRIFPGSDRPKVIDAQGNIWQGDRYFIGGEAQVTPPALLGLTSDPALFETYRRGEFSYKIPLAPGSYELHLYFADFLGPRLDFQSNKVVSDFLVFINDGATVWRHQRFPYTYATHLPLETEKIFKNVTPAKDGFLNLHFQPTANFSYVNAITVYPTPDGRARGIRIVAQGKPVSDRHGQVWLPDRYFTAGNLVAHGLPITGTPDPELFAGERYGNFQYIVPVADGNYEVKLYFVETWFGQGGLGSGGAGSRVFRVDCGTETLLNRFDILAETGMAGRVLVKTFPHIQPDEEGHIVLSFIPIENAACVNAIEIRDEG